MDPLQQREASGARIGAVSLARDDLGGDLPILPSVSRDAQAAAQVHLRQPLAGGMLKFSLRACLER